MIDRVTHGERAVLGAQMVKNLPAVQETWVQSLGWEDPLEEGMATHSSILAWRIPVDRGAWWATVHRVAKSCTRLSDQAQNSTTAWKKDWKNETVHGGNHWSVGFWMNFYLGGYL